MESRMSRVFRFVLLSVVCSLICLTPSNGRGQTTASVTAATTGDVVLLDFSADWCGPCQQMAPLIGEIGAAGWLVRHVDVDQEHDIVKRFQVTGVPCYILLVKGHEVGRIDGATTRSELEKLLAQSRQPLGLPKLAVPTDSPPDSQIPGIPVPVSNSATHLATESAVSPTVHPPAQLSGSMNQPLVGQAAERSLRNPQGAKQQPALAPPPTLAVETKSALQRNLIQATARLRVQDPNGASWGTGTVIDCRQGEALILTCGHIFRDSVGEGSIEVDLFGDPPDHPIDVLGIHLHLTQQVHLRPERRDLLLFRSPQPSHGLGKVDCSRVRRIYLETADSGTMKRLRLPADDLYQKALHLLGLEPFLRGSTNFRHGESESGA